MSTLINFRKALDEKKISAIELLNTYLNNIKKYDNEINSYITVCEEEAIIAAKEAQRLIDNHSSKQMTGIPIAIKDNICTKDIKTTCASKMLQDYVPIYNATAVSKLIDENAVILGKTNLDEFAMGDSNKTSFYGAVKNPYDVTRVAGGSSGGSAASVSANMAPVSLGTDTGGSVRQPAALCGITGLRPTYGTVSRYGLIAFASSLDQIGICANSAQDTGYLLNSIYGTDNNDLTTSKFAPGNYLGKINQTINGLRIAIPKEFLNHIVSDEIRKAFYTCIDYFKENGAIITEVSLPSAKYGISGYLAVSSAEATANLAKFDGTKYGHHESDIFMSRKEGFGKEVKKRILLGNYVLSKENYEKYYIASRDLKQTLFNEYVKIFNDNDIVISPTTVTTADTINSSNNNEFSQDFYTVTASLAGLPEITTTCGYDKSGLPIGFSITGKPFDEAKIISVADRYEKDFKRKEPIL